MKLLLLLITIGFINGLEDLRVEEYQNIIAYTTPPINLRPEEDITVYKTNLYSNKNEENARRFLQLYKPFNPVVLLVDTTRRSQEDATNFIKNVYKINPKTENINFMLMRFNTSGVTGVLETTQNNKQRFQTLLQQNLEEAASFLGHENKNKSVAFFSILNAAHILPPSSGIVVFVKRGVEDESLAQHALVETSKKRLKIFVVWGGSSLKSEGLLLKELAIRSGGDFMLSAANDLSDEYLSQFLENTGVFTTVSTILSMKNLRNEHNLHFPIDSDVTGIHISVSPNITRGILTTPRGYKIDVLESEAVAQYATGSFTKRDRSGGIHEIHINTTTASSRDVGLWSFRVSNTHTNYNVAIFAHTKLTAHAIITTTKNSTDVKKESGKRKKIMKLEVSGDVTLISNISFVNKDGKPIGDLVKLNSDKNWDTHFTENIENIETNQDNNKEFSFDVETVSSNEPFYVVVNGKDLKGNDFTRLSYVRSSATNDIFQQPPMTIDMGVASELITQPNRQPQLFFEVTNNGNAANLVQFYCSDEKSILLRMEPRFKWISPQETATVVVTLTTRAGSYQDVITFTAAGSQRVEKRVIVDVGLMTDSDDRSDPELSHHFTSDCLNVAFTSCGEGTWTVEVRARDTGSGMLQVSSKPKGLFFPNGFITGTKDQLTGYFSESCCSPNLQLVAVDRANNRRTLNINAYRANLGPGAIAAIVLGVILIIVIIIALIWCILKKTIWKDKESYDLPTYRGPNASSRRS